MNKKFWFIVGIVTLIILVIVIWWFVSKRISTPKPPPSPTVQPSPVVSERPKPISPASLYTFQFSRSDERLAEGVETAIDENLKQLLVGTEKGELLRFRLGPLPGPEPGFLVLSPNRKFAVAYFDILTPDLDEFPLYLLTEDQGPQRLHDTIREVGMINNEGLLIYHAEDVKGNVIARGKANREDERILARVFAQYLGFAVLDSNNLLYWGSPTAPVGENLYQLEISSARSVPLISDSSVTDASLSPSHKLLLVSRYLNDPQGLGTGTYSVWVYSLEKKQFIRDLGIDFDLFPIAWNEDETVVAFWGDYLDKAEIQIVSLETGEIETVGSFPSLVDTFPKPPISWEGKIITVYSEGKRQ